MSTIKKTDGIFHPFHVKKRLSKISENDKTLRLKLNILPLRYFLLQNSGTFRQIFCQSRVRPTSVEKMRRSSRNNSITDNIRQG